ncbi:MAG: glycosyltransferase family 2 protein [Mycobacteriaceae bacterium]|nr:glycosyltransferase family 2 protein [Mycobacteriaceae bacterium]
MRPVGGNRGASRGTSTGAPLSCLFWGTVRAIETSYPEVWIIVPAFNEATVIGAVIADVRSVFSNVVCVDDGSSDDTSQIALRQGAYVVRHPVNLGQGAAIQTGIEYARRQPGAQIFATFDGDGQHRVKDVAVMVDRLTASNESIDIVIGTRFGSGPRAGVSRPPLLKRIVLQTAAWLSPRGRRLGLTDTNNGLRVMNKKVADALDLTMSGMSHAAEFIMLIEENHWRVVEEPIEVRYTEYSKSKGQPLLNGVNIVFEGFLRARIRR